MLTVRQNYTTTSPSVKNLMRVGLLIKIQLGCWVGKIYMLLRRIRRSGLIRSDYLMLQVPVIIHVIMIPQIGLLMEENMFHLKIHPDPKFEKLQKMVNLQNINPKFILNQQKEQIRQKELQFHHLVKTYIIKYMMPEKLLMHQKGQTHHTYELNALKE